MAMKGSATPVTIFRVGHSTRTQDELIDLLLAHDIELLVDVRRWPRSRRNPQVPLSSARLPILRSACQSPEVVLTSIVPPSGIEAGPPHAGTV